MAIHPKPLPDPFDLIKDQLFYNRSTVNYTSILDETEADYHDQTTNVNPVQKTLSWTDITAKTTLTESKCSWLSCCGMKKGETTNIIINKVSGIAKAQSFLGIVGSRILVEGQCFVNGENIGEDICRISGYVQQDNIYIGILTVKEHLWFNAVLRLQQNSMDSDRQKRIEYVMDEMGLTKCQNTTIGIPGSLKGISGGEKKRLAFATELLTIPNILICDEPTSGLDSFTAHSVVQSLKNLATKGHTILATIHQPSPEVFSMFDDILIMTGGRVVFLGPKSDAMAFFSGLGYHCPKTCSVTDFFMETLAIIPGREKQSQGNNVSSADHVIRPEVRSQNICQRFEESDYSDVIKRQIHEQQDAWTRSSSAEPAEFSNRISKSTLHGVLKIVEMTSSFHYAYQIMVIAQWRNVHYLEYESDDEAEGISRNLNGTSIFSHEDSTLCYHSGLEIIKSYGYELNDIGYCFGCMIALLLATEILSGIALIFKVKRAK
ncbi:hypothetical protein LSH36_566g01070 [Paralvinella palmiformis]|uniref:ABC transporter domain-containing protein n=1 Tax=Paralvinella palmiformis TaxID=53620 RepID=A0AAD9J650_9ANNE|nr:hypothetical protein LSH36_566g01070 [Paralvinella palmiformis]